MKVLFLFESILPESYHSKTISPGELRVIAAVPKVNKVFALGRAGISFYDVNLKIHKQSFLEKKIALARFHWADNQLAYYFCWMGLLWHGIKLCRREQIDLIHAESPHISGIAAILLGKIFKVKVIIEYRVSYDRLLIVRYGKYIGTWGSWLFWKVAGFVMKSADLVAANSKTYKNYLKEKLHLDKVAHYNPGVIVPDNFKKERHSGFVIGFIGRLYKDKGPKYFLELIVVGQKWFRKNNVHFLMAGDGPERDKLNKYINYHKIEDLIDLLGTQDRWNFYQHLDLLINTTVVEAALEMTIAEAGLVGIPTIAFGNSGYPETVKNRYDGCIAQIGDTEKIYRQILHIFGDKALNKRLQKNAIDHSRLYTYESQVINLDKIYQRLRNENVELR